MLGLGGGRLVDVLVYGWGLLGRGERGGAPVVS